MPSEWDKLKSDASKLQYLEPEIAGKIALGVLCETLRNRTAKETGWQRQEIWHRSEL